METFANAHLSLDLQGFHTLPWSYGQFSEGTLFAITLTPLF